MTNLRNLVRCSTGLYETVLKVVANRVDYRKMRREWIDMIIFWEFLASFFTFLDSIDRNNLFFYSILLFARLLSIYLESTVLVMKSYCLLCDFAFMNSLHFVPFSEMISHLIYADSMTTRDCFCRPLECFDAKTTQIFVHQSATKSNCSFWLKSLLSKVVYFKFSKI